jgi:hypothetical protein
MLTSWSGLIGVACAGIMAWRPIRAHLIFTGFAGMMGMFVPAAQARPW